MDSKSSYESSIQILIYRGHTAAGRTWNMQEKVDSEFVGHRDRNPELVSQALL